MDPNSDSVSEHLFDSSIQKASSLKHLAQRHLKKSDEATVYIKLRNEHASQKYVW